MTTATIENQITRSIGPGGFPTIRLVHESGFQVVVCEYGGHVLSWTDPSGHELLFLSNRTAYSRGQPIRGGIPLVFPQFGKGVLPSHGFARVKDWKVVREQVTEQGAVSVTLRLTPDDEVLRMWPHAFAAELDIVLSDVLVTTMRVVNGDATPFSFFLAFHTYFRVGDVTTAAIKGLKGSKYVDFLRGRQEYDESRDIITLDSTTDRAYRNSPESVTIEAPYSGYRFLVTKANLSDTVVWNPWLEGNKAIVDLDDGDYAHMLCVESGNVLTPIELQPGETHTSGQVLRAEVM